MTRRIHSIVLLFVLLIGGAGMNYVQAAKLTGTCGAPGNEANVTWEYNEFGIKPVYIGWVIIRGTGPMMDFADYTQTPWYSKCARIVSVYVTQGVTTIGNNTFGGLYRVENVTIPHGVTSIGQNAFAGCSALTKVSIPHTVTSIGSEAFSSTNLTTLYVAWQNSIPAWVNLSDRTSQVTMHVPCGKTALYQAAAGWNNYNIADGPYYGTCSAGGNTDLPDWTLDCTGTLTIQADDAQMIDWYDLNAIPWYTIRGSIKQVVISGGVKSLGHHAFYDSQNITSVSLNPRLEKIGVLAFGFCRKLTSITIPNAVTSIGEMAFWYNESLTDVYVSWLGDAVPEMPSNIHNYEASRIRLHVPCSEPYIAKGWNTKFTLVVDQPLPSGTCGAQGNNLTWALDCNGTFTVSGSGDMADYSFYTAPWSPYMTSVQSVSISEGVTHIGNYAFYDSSIRSVNLPNSVTSIGNDAFAYCDKLTTVTIPSSVTSIGSLAFYGSDCPLTDIYVNWTTTATIPTWSNTTYTSNQSQVRLHVPCGTTAQYQAAKGWQNYIIREEPYRGTCGAQGDNLTWSLSCDGTLTISGTGAMVHYWAYEDIPWWKYRGSIQRIVIEEGVTTIGNHAFVQCSNLTSVSLPNTLTAISVLAFGHCTGLSTLVIPSSVTSMAGMFIHNTPSLTDVYVSWTGDAVPDMPADIHPHDASQKRLHIPCGQADAYVAKGWNNRFTLPGVISGTCGDNVQWTFESCNGTLSIFGTGAMSNYPGLNMPWKSHRASITSVVISDGVTSIGYNAFNGCSNLTSVTIPPSVTSIEQNAFYGCYAMESLYITDLAAWCNVEFGVSVEATPFMRNNYNSGSTEYLGGGNLYLNGTLVTTLTIPDGITEIKNLTFLGCSSITSIDFNQVTTIGSASFKGCHGLTSVTLPEGVTSLKNAFPYCTQLLSISIPASLTSLASQTLYHSDALTDIYVYWTDKIPGWPEYFTAKSPQPSITLHVPCGTEELYNTTANWKKYHIEGEGGPYTITVESDDPTMGTVDAVKIKN